MHSPRISAFLCLSLLLAGELFAAPSHLAHSEIPTVSTTPPKDLALTPFHAFISTEPPKGFHPFHSSDGLSANYLNQIFETLFSIDSEGGVQPLLAEKWKWTGPLELEIKLREGIRFQNGEPLNSEAVRFTFDLFTNPSFRIANHQYADSILSTELIDEYRIKIQTRYPDRLLPYRLATVGHILPPLYFAASGENEFSKKPVGTGPFQWSGYDERRNLHLRRNDQYWGPQTDVSEIIFHFFENFQTAIPLLKSGELHFIAHLPGTLTRQLVGAPRISVTKKLTHQSIIMIVNSAKAGSPLRDRSFRNALQRILDAQDIVKYYDMGNGVVSNSLSLPGEPYFNGSFSQKPPSEKSMKVLNRYKSYPFVMQVTEPLRIVGEIILKQMQEVGLNVTMKYGTNLDEVRELLEYKLNGLTPKIDFLVSHCAHRFPAFPHLVMLPSHGNWSMSNDPVLDQMLKNATEAVEVSDQIEQFNKINHYIHKESIIFPLFQFMDIYAHGTQFDFQPNSTAYMYFRGLRIKKDPTKKSP